MHEEIGQASHLSSCPSDHNVLMDLGVGLHFNVLLAAGRGHGEAPDLGAVVVANGLLLSIEAHALANEVPAAVAPDVEGHLKADNQDALVQLFGPFSQRMLPIVLQQKRGLSVKHCMHQLDSLAQTLDMAKMQGLSQEG